MQEHENRPTLESDRALATDGSSPDLYRALFDRSPDALLLVGADGRIVTLNQRATELFGCGADELIGAPIERFVPEASSDAHRGYREGYVAGPRPRAMGSPDQRITARRADGRAVPVDIALAPVDVDGRPHVMAVVRDITRLREVEDRRERQRREQRRATGLREAELEELDDFFERSPDLLCTASFDGYLKRLNPAWEAAFGHPREALLASPFLAFIHPEDRAATVAETAKLSFGGRTASFDNRWRTSSGEYRWLRWMAAARTETQTIYATARDITEWKNSQELLARAYVELQGAKQRAVSADQMKSAFLAAMSHELRTPLNSIIGFTSVLLQQIPGPINDEQAKQLDMVLTSGRHLLSLITDVLDFSKIEAGELKVHRANFDLVACLDEVTQSVRPLAEAKGLRVIVHAAPRSLTVFSDRKLVKQIALKLVTNAVNFTDEGEVALRWGSDGEVVSIAVQDTGVGIAPDALATLFRPFVQLSEGTKRTGAGLGLSISKRLADALGGTIAVSSRPGEGSTFTLTLPADGRTT